MVCSFSRILTEYGDILCKSLDSLRIQENANQERHLHTFHTKFFLILISYSNIVLTDGKKLISLRSYYFRELIIAEN